MAKKIKAAHIKKIIQFDNESQCEMYLSEKLGAKVLDRKVDDTTGHVTILVLEPYSHTPMLEDNVNLINDKDGIVVMTYVITRKGRSVKRIPFTKEGNCSGCGATYGQYHQYNCKKEICPICNEHLAICKCTVGYTLRKLEPKKTNV
ncbi:MAG: hypothetical protein K2H01_11040 [Ruminococcus sp.]|nr:hypothetical protein [Ruminococcus sp.]